MMRCCKDIPKAILFEMSTFQPFYYSTKAFVRQVLLCKYCLTIFLFAGIIRIPSIRFVPNPRRGLFGEHDERHMQNSQMPV